jgi:hemerythrin superfamily protein
MQERTNGRNHQLGDMLMGGIVGLALGVALNPARKLAVQALEATSGDWFEIIKTEHQAVEKLFEKLMQTDEKNVTRRQMLLTQIAYSLNKHAIAEENVIYPALRTRDEEAAKRLGNEHFDMKTLISRLQYDLAKDDPLWIERARDLKDLVLTHAREEEDEILSRFHAELGEEENASLTRRMNWEGIKVA